MRRWRARLSELLLSPGIPQRTAEWYAARTDLVTASDVLKAIGSDRYGSQKSFLVKKAGDPGEQVPFSGSAPPLKHGIMLEPVANAVYASRHGVRVHEFGLLRHRTVAHLGASPDGITDTGVMLELKCPYSRLVEFGAVPAEYYAQVQAQLEVCGLDEADFVEFEFDLADGIDSDFVDEDEFDVRERGVLVERPDDEGAGGFAYEYGPIEPRGAERVAWAAAAVERCAGVERHWRVRRVNHVRVQRDPEYVANMLAKLEDVWALVMRYRGDREAYRTEVVLGKGRRTASTPTTHDAERRSDPHDEPLVEYAFR